MDVMCFTMRLFLVCCLMGMSRSDAMFEEPRCSKFDFEERLLEKVVRFEHKLETLETKMDSLAEHLMEEQRSLTADKNQLLVEVQTLKDGIVSDIQTVKDNFSSDTSVLRADIEAKQAAVDKQFQELIRTTRRQVERISLDAETLLNKTSEGNNEIVSAFTVKGPQLAADINEVKNSIRFETVVYMYNSSDAEYNTATGEFTCRNAGLYYFSLSIVKKRTGTRQHDSTGSWIYKGSEQLVYAYLDPTDDDTDRGGYETSAFATTYLVPGDVVFVGGGTSVDTMNLYSSFSGFLVKSAKT